MERDREEVTGLTESQASQLSTEFQKVIKSPRTLIYDKIIDAGLFAMHLRIPYKFGGNWIVNGTLDGSAFMMLIFDYGGIVLRRTAIQQATQGEQVDWEGIRRGDLVFTDMDKSGTINHVGLALGDGTVLHTDTPSKGIHLSKLTDWRGAFITARRIP